MPYRDQAVARGLRRLHANGLKSSPPYTGLASRRANRHRQFFTGTESKYQPHMRLFVQRFFPSPIRVIKWAWKAGDITSHV